MYKICLTGGPCGGKSSALSIMQQKLSDRGYKVVTVPEAATKIIMGGVVPGRDVSTEDFQRLVLDEQVHNEELFGKALEGREKVIMICDRGVPDQYAYVPKERMMEIMAEKSMSVSDAFSRYDCVLHLTTAADGAVEHYLWNDPKNPGKSNNAARSESPEEAVKLDRKTLNAWIGHPRLRQIKNEGDFEGKMGRVLEETFSALGEPIPCEIERKFLVKAPEESKLEELGQVSKVGIVQTYLRSDDPSLERRVRRRGTPEEGYMYFYTEKRNAGEGMRMQAERMIGKEEYDALRLREADPERKPVEKERFLFVYEGKYFELDFFPFDTERAILEVELLDLEEPVKLPPLDFIKEVTGDPMYKNSEIARTGSLTP